MVRQRNRGGIMGAKVKHGRVFKAVSSLPTGTFSSATGFDSSPSKADDVKLRASEITGGARRFLCAVFHCSFFLVSFARCFYCLAAKTDNTNCSYSTCDGK